MQPGAVLDRCVHLPGVPASAGHARRLLRQWLDDAGHREWADEACLAASELVTNALLHAHSAIEFRARVFDDHVRVEVRDFNPALPSARSYDEHATTGRGLELVAAVAAAHGVDSLGPDGKIVWFCVGSSAQLDHETPEELPAEWADLGEFTGRWVPVPGAVRVVLRDMPATLWLAAREHHDALLRELALLGASGVAAERAVHLGQRADLAAADSARFTIGHALDGEIRRARATGAASVPLPQYHPGALPSVPAMADLEVRVRPEQAGQFAQLQDALDEGERLAAAGRLLVRPGLPEITAVRDWACEQVIAQLAGSPAAPWIGADDERFTRDVDSTAAPSGWDTTKITLSDVGAIAVDDANRVVAISAPLADLLGWAADDLVGRRVVAIVPPRFREAHVAGFSRHLSTGEARALGVSLQLPVLRADGTEVLCEFLIDSEPTPSGRTVYLAWISPIRDPTSG